MGKARKSLPRHFRQHLRVGICPWETGSRRMFEYDFRSTENRDTLVNVDEFPALAKLSFLGVESIGFYHLDRRLHQHTWISLRPLFLAEGKARLLSSKPLFSFY